MEVELSRCLTFVAVTDYIKQVGHVVDLAKRGRIVLNLRRRKNECWRTAVCQADGRNVSVAVERAEPRSHICRRIFNRYCIRSGNFPQGGRVVERLCHG